MEVLRAVRVYCCDHYGSMLWDMQGDMVKQYCNSWNTCIKLAWGVSRATHTYFLDYLSGGLIPVKIDILSRYAGFFQSLLSSPSKEVSILARIVSKDIRSTTARNIRLIERETGGLTWTATSWKIREEIVRRELKVSDEDSWRIEYLGKLLEKRDTLVYCGQEDSEEVVRVQGLLDSLCSN